MINPKEPKASFPRVWEQLSLFLQPPGCAVGASWGGDTDFTLLFPSPQFCLP